MRRKKILVFVVVFIIVLPVIFKDFLIKSCVSTAVGAFTGTKVTIDAFSFSPIKSSIRMKGFKMYNPKGFPPDILIDIPSVGVDYDMAALFKRSFHAHYLEVNVREVGIIKNKDGKLNVNSLKFAEQAESAEKTKAHQQSPAMPFRIDVFTLQIDRIVVRDFTVGQKPSVQVYPVGIKKGYKNITGAQQLAALIMSEALGPTALRGAAVYGVAALAGVAILPVGVASILIGKDSAQAEFQATADRAFQVSVATMKEMGAVSRQDAGAGVIGGKVQGCDVAVKISALKEKTVRITVSARKYMLPRPQIAGGVLYEISGKLK